MAAAMMTDQMKDEVLTQFLSMTEDRVDPDVAQNLLEVVNWDMQAAMEQLYGGPGSPGHSRPASAMPREPRVGFLDPMAAEDGDSQAMMDEDDEDFARAAAESSRTGHSRSPPRHQHGPGAAAGEMDDPHFAAAVEASYRAQTTAGRVASEEELISQALRISQQEEESRQRRVLLGQQEAELAESILMDQMREQQEREGRHVAAEMERVAEEERVEHERRAVAELEAKRARLPDEPPAGEPGRLALMLRLPNGQRLQRAFRASETIGVLYDFVDLQSEELAGQGYRLVSTMPRKAYEDRQPTLAAAGIQNQFVLLVEPSSGL